MLLSSCSIGLSNLGFYLVLILNLSNIFRSGLEASWAIQACLSSNTLWSATLFNVDYLYSTFFFFFLPVEKLLLFCSSCSLDIQRLEFQL